MAVIFTNLTNWLKGHPRGIAPQPTPPATPDADPPSSAEYDESRFDWPGGEAPAEYDYRGDFTPVHRLPGLRVGNPSHQSQSTPGGLPYRQITR